jgi:putative hydrolase of the HAD superfamily
VAVRGLSSRVQKALLLDALGTLVALEPPAPRLAEALSVPIADAERAIAAEMTYYRAHLNDGRDQRRLVDLRRRCARVMAAELPASTIELSPDALLDALLSSLEFTAFPDVRPALETARERGQRLVVVSNWDVSLREVLDRLELLPLLDGVVVSAEVGAAKPDPAPFERALRIAGAEASAATHVGDSLVEDIEGARAAGVEPILISRSGAQAPLGVRTIASLSELDPHAPAGRGDP